MGEAWTEPYYVTIKVHNRECKVLNMVKALGARWFNIVDIRGYSEGSIRHLVELSPKLLEEAIRQTPLNMEARQVRKGGKTLVWFESEGCNICNTILSQGSFLVSGRTSNNTGMIFSFITPHQDAYRSIIMNLKDKGCKVKVLRVRRANIVEKVLTPSQERTLWIALKAGYFDYPRRISTEELSRILGISGSTLSEILRRGIRRLLEHYFES